MDDVERLLPVWGSEFSISWGAEMAQMMFIDVIVD